MGFAIFHLVRRKWARAHLLSNSNRAESVVALLQVELLVD